MKRWLISMKGERARQWLSRSAVGRWCWVKRAGWVLGLVVLGMGVTWVGAQPGNVREEEKKEAVGAELPGATLRTNQDHETLLRKGRELIEGKRYREAVAVLQYVLDEGGQELATGDGKVYRPMRAKVEAILAGLPREGLEEYRLLVDGKAAGLWETAGAKWNEAALAEMVQRYFFSAVGVKAAYQWACLRLDRGDWAGARQLLRRLADEPMRRWSEQAGLKTQVMLRLAMCEAMLGDAGAARAALQEVRAGEGVVDLATGQHVSLVEELMTQQALVPRGQAEVLQSVRFGDLTEVAAAEGMSERTGVMGAGGEGGARVWLRLWGFEHELAAPPAPGTDGARNMGQRPQHRGQMVTRWEKMQWRPTAQVVGDGRVVVFRTHRALVAMDGGSGEVVWEAREPEPRFWANAGQYTTGFIQRDHDRIVPTGPEEILFFGDRMNRAVTLMDGAVYTIEAQVQAASLGQPLRMFPGRMPATLPPNVLAVYELSSGQLRWRKDSFELLPEGERQGKEPAVGVGVNQGGAGRVMVPTVVPYRYVGLPVVVREQVLVAVEKEDDLALASLSAADGRVNWIAPLCQGPLGGGADWSGVGLTVQGERVYVASGRGVVLAVDATDGSVLWATRYERPRRVVDRMNPLGGYRDVSPAAMGWEDDAVMLMEGVVVVTPSDSERLVGLDALTGEYVLDVPRAGSRYVLGMRGQRMWVGSGDHVACYDVGVGLRDEQRMIWRTRLEGSAGRGLVMGRSVLVPEGRAVVELDAESGQKKRVMQVATGGGDPVGNLFSDGERFYVVGMERASALADSRWRLAQLEKRIAAGDWAARLERAQVRLLMDELVSATEDLRVLLMTEGLQESMRDKARGMLVDGLLRLAERDPARGQQWLPEAEKWVKGRGEIVRLQMATARELERGGRFTEAMSRWRELAMDMSGLMLPMGAGGDETQVQTAVLAGQQLESLVRRQTDLQATLETIGRRTLEEAKQGAATVEWLLAMARAHPDTAAGFEAVGLAAGRLRDGGHFERAELLLTQLAESSQRRRAAAGLAALARLYAQEKWQRQAAATWQRLRDDYGDELVVMEGVTQQAKVWAAEALAEMNGTTQGLLKAEALREVPTEVAWTMTGGGFQLLTMAGGTESQFTLEHVLMVDNGSGALQGGAMRRGGVGRNVEAGGLRARLMCVQAGTGKVVWEAPMPMGLKGGARESLAVVRLSQPEMMGGVVGLGPGQFVLVRDGHVGLLVSQGELVGMGLVSGKVLWSMARHQRKTNAEASVVKQGSISEGDNEVDVPYDPASGRVAVGGGLVAQVTLERPRLVDQLRVYDAGDGTLLWTKRFERQGVDEISVAGRWLVATTEGGRRVHVMEGRTGMLVGRFVLPDRMEGAGAMFLQDGVIYQGYRGVSKRQLPGGELVWVTPSDRRQTRMSLLDERTLGLLPAAARSVWLVDTRHGKLVMEASSQSERRGFNDMALDPSGRWLHLLGFGESGQMQLTVVDRESGQMEVTELGQRNAQRPSAATAALSGLMVPMLQMQEVAVQPGQPVRERRWVLTFVRKGSGEAMEVTVKGLPATMDGLTGVSEPAVIHGGVMMINTQRGIVAMKGIE